MYHSKFTAVHHYIICTPLTSHPQPGIDIEPVLEEGAEGHDHNHGHEAQTSGESCACAAKGKFNIDCSAEVGTIQSIR